MKAAHQFFEWDTTQENRSELLERVEAVITLLGPDKVISVQILMNNGYKYPDWKTIVVWYWKEE